MKLNSISINAVMCDPVHEAETVHGLLSANIIWNPFLKYAVCRASLVSKETIFICFYALVICNHKWDGLWTLGSLVRDLDAAQFVVALS